MRKKATYWGLGLLVALGLTATAGTGLLPTAMFGSPIATAAEGDEEEKPDPEYQQPISETPADGSELGTKDALSNIKITFKKDVQSIIRSCADPIVIKLDGQPYQTIYASDVAAVRYGSTSSYDVELTVEPMVKPGVYTFEVPAGMFMNSLNDTSKSKPNMAFTFSYTVVQSFSYSAEPAAGSELLEFSTSQPLTITFEGVKSIAIDNDICEPEDLSTGARIDYFNKANPTFKSSVSLKAEGNKLIVTPDNNVTDVCTNLSNFHYELIIPKGGLKFTDESGNVVPSSRLSLTYYVTAIPQNLLKIIPAPGEDYLNSVNDLDVVQIDASAIPGVSVTTSSMYSKQAMYLLSINPATGAIGTARMATYTVTLDEETKVITMTRNQPTSATVQLNNPQLWERGSYALQIPANIIMRDGGTKKNLVMNFRPYNLPGLTNVNPSSITPADNSTLDPATGLYRISMAFSAAMTASDKEIKVYKQGAEATPIYTFAANNARYVTPFNSDKNFYIDVPAIKDGGAYVVEIPEGAFRQSAGAQLPSSPQKLTYTVANPIAADIVPANGAFLTEMEKLTITFTGATDLELVKADAITPMGGTGGQTAQTAYAATPSVEGNTLTLTLKKKYATLGANALYFNIPSGVVKMKIDGKEVENYAYDLTYHFDYLEPGTVAPAGTVTVDQLGKIYLYPPKGYTFVNVNTKYIDPANTTEVFKLMPYKADGSLNTGSAAVVGAYKLNCETTTLSASGSSAKTYNRPVVREDGSVELVNNGNYNMSAIPSGKYALRIPGGSSNPIFTYQTVENAPADATTVEQANDVYPRAPWDFNYEIQGLATDALLTNVLGSMETIPEQFVFEAENGGDLSFFENFVPKIYLQRGTSTSSPARQTLITEVKDGKIIATLPQDVYQVDEEGNVVLGDDGNPVVATKGAITAWSEASGGLYGQKYTFYTQMQRRVPATEEGGEDTWVNVASTAVSGITTGSFKITKDGKELTNSEQALTFTAVGPMPDPYKAFTPAEGNFKIAENPAGLTEITFTTDASMPVEVNYSCTDTGLILVDGKNTGKTFNVFDLERVADNSIRLYLAQPIAETGKYTVIYPRGMFLFGNLKTSSAEFSVTYNVEGLAPVKIASVTPVDETIVTQFDGVTLNFDGIEIASVEKIGDIYYQVNDPLAELPSMSFQPLDVVLNPDKKSVLLTFSEEDENMLKEQGLWPVADPGTYVINYGANAIMITDTEGNLYGTEAGFTTLRVIPDVALTYTPEGYFASLKDMTVTFAGIEKIEAYPGATTQATLVNGTTNIPVTVSIKGGALEISTATELTELGTYTLNIPENTYKLTRGGDKPAVFGNRAITHDFVIGEAPKIGNIIPRNNSTLTDFSVVNLFYTASPSITKDSDLAIKLYRDDAEIMSLNRKNNQIKIDPDNDLCVLLQFYSERITTPGVYKVVIPDGFFLVSGVPMAGETLTYTVLPAMKTTFMPLPDSTIESLTEVRMTVANCKEVIDNKAVDTEENAGAIRICNVKSDKDLCVGTREGDITIDGNVVIFKCTGGEAPLAKGEYRLFIPAGSLTFVNEDNVKVDCPEIIVSWFVPEIEAPILSIVPGDVKPDAFAGDLSVTLHEGETFSMWLPAQPIALYPVTAEGQGEEITRWLYNFQEYGSANGKQTITLDNQYKGEEALTVPTGDYLIKIAKGALMINCEPFLMDEDDPTSTSTTKVAATPYFYYYTVVDNPESVSSIFDDASSFNIYSVDGRIIKLDADADYVNSLEPGLYIINARRVLIRK